MYILQRITSVIQGYLLHSPLNKLKTQIKESLEISFLCFKTSSLPTGTFWYCSQIAVQYLVSPPSLLLVQQRSLYAAGSCLVLGTDLSQPDLQSAVHSSTCRSRLVPGSSCSTPQVWPVYPLPHPPDLHQVVSRLYRNTCYRRRHRLYNDDSQ
jgi:hypothetical protein